MLDRLCSPAAGAKFDLLDTRLEVVHDDRDRRVHIGGADGARPRPIEPLLRGVLADLRRHADLDALRDGAGGVGGEAHRLAGGHDDLEGLPLIGLHQRSACQIRGACEVQLHGLGLPTQRP